MSWHGENNPHFWPRDPPRPPTEQQPGPSRQPPIRPRERPDHVRLPPAAQPVTDHPRPLRPSLRTRLPEDPPGPASYQPGRRQRPQEQHDHVRIPVPVQPEYPPGPSRPQLDPRAHQPEYELTPAAGPNPELIVPPTSQDHWPMHPHEPSEAHWPLHPHPPKPHAGPTAAPPPPRRQAPPQAPVLQPERWQPSNLIYPSPNRTNPCTWFIAVLCIILWVVIILGGILILIIYLAYRPRSPQFEILNASLNAAYLDMGYLLNADLTLLVNFTNPNKKMSVDLNFIVLKLRYENYLIANQYIEPFEAGKLEHKFARVEMVGSQIRLPVLVTQQLVKQIQGNKITFELHGYFHARSRLGSIFRYSYWLYSHCKIVTRGPPSGVVVFSKCVTKR